MPADPPEPARVLLSAEGPLLVHGPVRVELPDGRQVESDRPVTALCGCRRSRRYPFCDASHRTRGKATRAAGRDETRNRGEDR